jgi:cysteinyl-tRNA synthetase
MDLTFPHHECEIAQAKAANQGKQPVRYWMHNNMVTVNGQKMSKSVGNVIKLIDLFDGDNKELFEGENPILSQTYSPMVVRLFILQVQYRSTMDFSDKALKDTQKNYFKFINALKGLKKMQYTEFVPEKHDKKLEEEINADFEKVYGALDDDLNTALALTHLFNINKKINTFQNNPDKIGTISKETFEKLKTQFVVIFEDILGIQESKPQAFDELSNSLLAIYQEAKANKQYDKVDKIRADFKKIGITLKDTKYGIDWAYTEE